MILNTLFILVYFSGVLLALLVPLITGAICGFRMERVGRGWGAIIGAAVGILAAALVLAWLGSPLALIRLLFGPYSFGFGVEVLVFPSVLAVLGGVLVWLVCFLLAYWRKRRGNPVD